MDTRFISNFFRSGLVVSVFFIGFTNTNPVLAAACTANASTTADCTGPLTISTTTAGTISNANVITSTGSSGGVQQNAGITLGGFSNTQTITSQSSGYFNYGAITSFTNTGSITGTDTTFFGVGINNQTGATVTTLTNSGSITGASSRIDGSGGSGIYNHSGVTITTLTNSNSGSITGTATGSAKGNGIWNYGGLITTLTNAGSITGTSASGTAYGIYNEATITTLTNTGSITGTSASGTAYGINNGGIITTLNNGQGLAGALTYTGVLPVNYNIIVNSPTSFGKLSATTVTGSMTFGIYDSTLRKGTYSAVLTGIASSGAGSVLASSTTGIYNGFTYTLINSAGTTWDLSISGASTADTQLSLAASAYALRGVYNLQTATINNGLNYDCTVFDTHGVCISVGGRYTSTDSPGTNNGNALVVASYNLTDHVRVGGYLDQNISNSTPTGIKLNNGSPLAGLFGVWNEHKSGEGLEVRVAAGYGDKDLTVTRSAIGTSEAGVGKSQLTSQAVSTTVSYGTALASNWMVSPYAGVRYTRIKAGRYTEGSSTDVTAPLTYDALVQQSTTALAGVRFSGRASPKTLLTMSAGVEQDTSNNNVGNSYNASGVTGLTPITFNSNIQKTRAVANAGVYYDITNTQRIGLNAMYRQEAFQSTNTVTALVTYQVGL